MDTSDSTNGEQPPTYDTCNHNGHSLCLRECKL